MTIRGLSLLPRAARWLRNRFMSGGVILVYHRVAELPSDPQLLCVTPQHFAEHLEVLRKCACPMRLQQLVQALRDGNLPERAVVVTFDDGYADNLSHAKPLLEHYELPATFFVTTGYIGSEREFWWDELDRLLLQPGTLPESLRLNVNGSACEWELGAMASYSEEDCGHYRGWNVLGKDDPSPRHALYRSLCQLLRPMPEGERQVVLCTLSRWAGADSRGRPTYRPLSSEEVVNLAEGDLVEVGAHTVSHSVLSKLPAVEQRSEIQTSKAHLEEMLGRPVSSFAYPYGSPSDYTGETTAIVREAGFSLACSNFEGMVSRGTDPYQLPRVVVRDWSGETLGRMLDVWFGGSVE